MTLCCLQLLLIIAAYSPVISGAQGGNDPFPPPLDIHLADVGHKLLRFTWTAVIKCVPLLNEISASESCGACPRRTAVVSASCAFNVSHVPGVCGFAVRTIVCNNITGNWSKPVIIIQKVPNPVITTIQENYTANGDLTALVIEFRESDQDIRNTANYIHSYSIVYADAVTGHTCASETTVNLTCFAPSSCFPASNNILVSLSGANRFGDSQKANITIPKTNQNISVSTSAEEITCKFLEEQTHLSTRLCNVSYGRCTETLDSWTSQWNYTTTNSPLMVKTDFKDYCYIVNAIIDNVTTIIITGNHTSKGNDDAQVHPALIAFLATIAAMLSSVIVVVAFIIIAFKIYRKYHPYGVHAILDQPWQLEDLKIQGGQKATSDALPLFIDRPPIPPISATPASLSDQGMCVDSSISNSFIPHRQSVHFREAEERAVTFLFHHVLECDCSGQQYTIEDHDITLRVPIGAVAEGDKVHFEIGVVAYGPFHFPENTQPISPIVWLCLLEDDYELKKPFQLTIPHILSQISKERMRHHEAKFAKASHSDHVVSKNVMSYKFNNCDIEPFFTSVCKQSYGALVSKHFCFYCLKAKQTAELAVDAGYSLVRVETFLSPQRNEINFCTIYLLKTCLKSLEEQFPREEGCRITSCHDFKFSADNKVPHLEMIVPSKHDCCSIAMEPLAAKIRASDIDFWSMGVDKMQMKHYLKMYPPRLKMTVSMKSSDLAFKLPIKFNGCSDDSQLDIELTFPLGLPLSMRSMSSSFGSSSILHADSQSPTIKCGPPALADAFRKLLSISTHWKNIGTILSIPSSTLDRIERDEQDVHSRLREMLTQRFKADHQPSWTQLIDAVEPFDPSKAEELRKSFKDYPT